MDCFLGNSTKHQMTVCLSVYYSLVTCQETALLRQKHSWAQNEKLVRVNVIFLRQFLGMFISYHTKEEKRKSNISLSLTVFNINCLCYYRSSGFFLRKIQTQFQQTKRGEIAQLCVIMTYLSLHNLLV